MPATAEPDVRQLSNDDLPRSPFPASPRSDFRVFFAPAAHDAIWKHAGENRTVEVCGVLVGRCEQDEDGPFVSVTNTIRCDEATSKFAEVTFTHESWSKINAEMDTKYADLRIVGWYHTHPDFGIFLSERDTFIHQNFFSNPGQIAHVVDPVRRVEGVFTWRQGRPVACSHFWVGDRILMDGSGDRPGGAPARTMASVSSGPAHGESGPPARDDESIGALLRVALPLVLTFLLGYLLSGLMTGWRSEAERNRMFRDVLTELHYWKLLRPGLTEKLQTIERRLEGAAARIQDLADEHVELAGDEARAKRSEWTEVFSVLQETRGMARELHAAYGLTADEAAILDDIIRRQAERAEAEAAREAAQREPKQKGSAPKSDNASGAEPERSGTKPQTRAPDDADRDGAQGSTN